jgi:hypothetical protein
VVRAEMPEMLARLGEVLHFSEDADITEFVPRRAPKRDVLALHATEGIESARCDLTRFNLIGRPGADDPNTCGPRSFPVA